ncbi:MAG: tetratricopeptide repeat protein [bacterium]
MTAAMLSCAYYNIFWTANKEYDRATGPLPYAEFWDPYEQQKPPGDKLKLLDSAAERSGKVLVLHPDSKWVDDALLLMGKCFLLAGDYDKALTKFREIGTLYPDGSFAEEARYLEAYTLVIQETASEAVPILQNLAGNAEDKLIREKATYLAARIAFQGGDCLIAIDSYAAYLEAYPDGGRAERARLDMGQCLVKLGMYREAVEELEPLIGEMDGEGVLALLRMGKAYRMMGETSEAMGVFDQVILGAEEDSLRSRAGVEQALTLLDEGRHDQAIQTLELADSLGNRMLSGEINYRIGLIYERDLKDFDTAIAHYDDSVKKKSPYSRKAANRSKALKNVNKYREEISAGTGDIAKSRYLLAETYLYDLGMQDEALVELTAVADSFPESEYAARSMLALASFLEDEGDTTARVYYGHIIEGFPETPYANVARVALGLAPLDVVIEEPGPAPPDTAGGRSGVPPQGTRTAEGLEGPPEMEGPERFPPGYKPAGGDTLAVTDSTGSRPMIPPGFETYQSRSDSARARYEKYREFSRPASTPPDSGEEDTGDRDEQDGESP